MLYIKRVILVIIIDYFVVFFFDLFFNILILIIYEIGCREIVVLWEENSYLRRLLVGSLSRFGIFYNYWNLFGVILVKRGELNCI